MPPGLFTAEAHGLALLAASAAVRVPRVYACAEATVNTPAFLLAEYLQYDAHPLGDPMAMLGEQLAALHRAPSPQAYGLSQAYGLAQDNFIGATPAVQRLAAGLGRLLHRPTAASPDRARCWPICSAPRPPGAADPAPARPAGWHLAPALASPRRPVERQRHPRPGRSGL